MIPTDALQVRSLANAGKLFHGYCAALDLNTDVLFMYVQNR